MPTQYGKSKAGKKRVRHDPLAASMAEDPGYLSTPLKAAKRARRKQFTQDEDMEEDVEKPMSVKMSKKVLDLAKEQRQESIHPARRLALKNQKGKPREVNFDLSLLENEDFSDDEAEYNKVGADGLTPEEEAALSLFAPKNTQETQTLRQLVGQKIIENERAKNLDDVEEELEKRMPKEFVNVFKDVGKVLQNWKSGRLPKAFKIIPNLANWEEVLQLTRPEEWSPNVMYYATKMFASNLRVFACQRFYNCVLLPAVRDDIARNKKLNYHYYQACKKSLFKSKAFYRGFLIPLCQQGCTPREALILSGLVGKKSIPRLETCAAIYKLLELPYSGPTSIFLKVLLNKKYALPSSLIDVLVSYFRKFQKDPRKLPVVWNQLFLVFAQRYKTALNNNQKESLKEVMRVQFHHQITPEIRRELFSITVKENQFESMDI